MRVIGVAACIVAEEERQRRVGNAVVVVGGVALLHSNCQELGGVVVRTDVEEVHVAAAAAAAGGGVVGVGVGVGVAAAVEGRIWVVFPLVGGCGWEVVDLGDGTQGVPTREVLAMVVPGMVVRGRVVLHSVPFLPSVLFVVWPELSPRNPHRPRPCWLVPVTSNIDVHCSDPVLFQFHPMQFASAAALEILSSLLLFLFDCGRYWSTVRDDAAAAFQSHPVRRQ